MAIISPLAEHLIQAGDLRAWHTPARAMEALVYTLEQLHQPGYTLLELDITVAGGSDLVPYRSDDHTIRAIGFKGEVFDLAGKHAARVIDRAAYRLYPGTLLLTIKRHGKPRVVQATQAFANPDTLSRMLQAGHAWQTERQARALQGQTRDAQPLEPVRRSRL